MNLNIKFFSLSAFKILSQLTLMSPLLYLYFIGELDVVGEYMVIVPFVSILFELIASEWVKFSIFRQSYKRKEVQVYFIGFCIIITFLISSYFIYKPSELTVVLLTSSLLINLIGQHLVDIFSLEARLKDDNVFFEKILQQKLIWLDILFPLMITLLLSSLELKVAFNISLTFFITLILIAVVGYFILLKTALCSPLAKGNHPISIYPYLLAKRVDSQSFRLALSLTMSPTLLGSLFPIVVVGRGINIIGNFVHYYFLKQNTIIFKYINNWKVVTLTVIVLPLIIIYVVNFFLIYFEYPSVSYPLGAAFVAINISAVFRLFSRGVRIKYGKNRDVAINLFSTAISKFSLVYLLSAQNISFMYLFLLYLVIEVLYDCKKALSYIKINSNETLV